MKKNTIVLIVVAAILAFIVVVATIVSLACKNRNYIWGLLAVVFIIQMVCQRMDRRDQAKHVPPPPDEDLDESLLPKVPEILGQCGEKEPAAIPESILPLAPRVRAFLEMWKSLDFWRGLDFEGVFSEYKREEIALYEDNPRFVVLASDGGEETYFVRRDAADESVYIVDLEMDSDWTKPRLYASDIDRWIVLRRQDAIIRNELEREERGKRVPKQSRRKRTAAKHAAAMPSPAEETHAESAESNPHAESAEDAEPAKH